MVQYPQNIHHCQISDSSTLVYVSFPIFPGITGNENINSGDVFLALREHYWEKL